MDGMKEDKADFADIIDIIDGLWVGEIAKQNLLRWVREKKNGSEKAGDILCKAAIMLHRTKAITPEQHAQIIVFARQREQKRSDGGIWTRFKCFLKRLFLGERW